MLLGKLFLGHFTISPKEGAFRRQSNDEPPIRQGPFNLCCCLVVVNIGHHRRITPVQLAVHGRSPCRRFDSSLLRKNCSIPSVRRKKDICAFTETKKNAWPAATIAKPTRNPPIVPLQKRRVNEKSCNDKCRHCGLSPDPRRNRRP